MCVKNHLIFCLSFIIFFWKFLKKLNIYLDLLRIIPISFLSCLIPDIDHPRSFLGYKFKFISIMIFNLFGHRTITHSFLGLILLILFIIYINIFFLKFNFDIIFAIFLGYFSHIFCDMFTYKGVFFLWPYKIKFRIPIFYFFLNKKNDYYFCIFLLFMSIIINNLIFIKNLLINFLSICLYCINLII